MLAGRTDPDGIGRRVAAWSDERALICPCDGSIRGTRARGSRPTTGPRTWARRR